MSLSLSTKTEDIIKAELNIENLSDCIDMDYQDINTDNDFNRDLIMKVANNVCGNVCFHNELFYTNREFDEKRKQVFALKL